MEEVTNRSHSDSRDPLTPELQDPAPQKKKKKKKAPTIGSKAHTAPTVTYSPFCTQARPGINQGLSEYLVQDQSSPPPAQSFP